MVADSLSLLTFTPLGAVITGITTLTTGLRLQFGRLAVLLV